jgi:hypothetical protein
MGAVLKWRNISDASFSPKSLVPEKSEDICICEVYSYHVYILKTCFRMREITWKHT